MSKLQKLETKVTTDNYQKFLFFLMQHNPFLALYFRCHQPTEEFIQDIIGNPNATDQEIKTKLFTAVEQNTKNLNKIAHMTKLIFGVQKVPGMVEDYLGVDWAEKKVNLKGFLFFDYFNEVNKTNIAKILGKFEYSFDRWFFCKIYFPRAQQLNLNDQVKIVEEYPEQKNWAALITELKNLPHFAPVHSPYPKEHIARYWPE
jgi:hypothetical protein